MRETDDLSPEARDLIDGARHADGPTDRDRSRVRERLLATIASGAAGTVASSAASSAAASTAGAGVGGLSLGAKVLTAIALAGAVGGTFTAAVVAPREGSTTSVESSTKARANVATKQGSVASGRTRGGREVREASFPGSDDPSVANAGSEVELDSSSNVGDQPVLRAWAASDRSFASRRPRPAPASARSEPPAAADQAPEGPEPEAATAGTLAAELALLGRAQHALRHEEPDAALRHLAEHAQRYPDGELSEEREATRVLALCAAGDREGARRLAARFLREHPTSPLSSRVRNCCD